MQIAFAVAGLVASAAYTTSHVHPRHAAVASTFCTNVSVVDDATGDVAVVHCLHILLSFVRATSKCVEWDMRKDPDAVSEDEYIVWFKQGYDVNPQALDTLKKRVQSAVVFHILVPDADSRIGRMLDGLAVAIRRDRQESVIREVSQTIVKIITDAVVPASLHRAITEQMALTRNTPLKKDVYRFVRWLRQYAIPHERFVGYDEELEPPQKPDLLKPPGSKDLGVRRIPRGDAKPLAPAPNASAIEAKQLLRAHRSTFKRGRSSEKGASGAPGGRVATVKTDVPDGKRLELPAIVDGVLPVQASLLDSGADLSVTTGGLVSALLTAGASPEITVMVRWNSDPPVELTLGYNQQTLLENARRQEAVWDFEVSDGMDDDEGMACATPELGNTPDHDGPVRIVLESKVAEAATAGMPTAAVEQLQDLLMEFREVFRLKFGRDPPVKVESLKVRLEEGAMPVKSGLRRYPLPHMAFLEKHVRELDKAVLVYRNTRSRWVSAPRIVPKKIRETS
ncbi:hypothetical protein H257_10291 [Aphanomyces astaci]|uniref:Peptidase A2 domain-containing protein n=1 Tax=Aphanomyces astaci TaxID=112090 RepID=W4G701_APHAT|nr:hypothetical protein H257_10291 [Aphanomyces astaci]ETV75450.1 hypothetical protein H257_10291 [Aphanomyces astaci]|eukprot:XP_009835084.1 hypothetical protein H257_10291 [Aphanomyces astaci]